MLLITEKKTAPSLLIFLITNKQALSLARIRLLFYATVLSPLSGPYRVFSCIPSRLMHLPLNAQNTAQSGDAGLD
jgi:hypothetical protein